MPYRDWEPGERMSSPGSTRHTFKVRNRSGERGKYSLKNGSQGTEQFTISSGQTERHDCGDQAVVGVNKGKGNLEWLRD